ncbi:MAG: hypothetical protein HZA92_08860 [Verrucomicrobia bacterium]|nr:hypothetical protein [Verrucomicrobiota bacterium]
MTNPSKFEDHSRRLLAFIERGSGLDETEFSASATELFALQFAHVAPYRRLCEARRVTPDSLPGWRQIPAMPTTAFKELELTSLAPAERTAVFHSSGTTGHLPSRHFHNARSLAVYEASLLSWFERHIAPAALVGRDSVEPHMERSAASISGAVTLSQESRFVRTSSVGSWGSKESRPAILCLAPPPEQAPHSSLVHMFAAVSREFGSQASRFLATVAPDNSWSLDFAAALAALRHAEQAAQPPVLLGTAFMFVHLLDALAQDGLSITLPPGSRVMETGGYKGRSREVPKAELHALLTSRLSIPRTHLVCEYGMSELSSQAYDRVAGSPTILSPLSSLFSFPPWARAVVISPETGREVAEGETGLLRIFDLANVRSVMAIQTEDLAVRRGEGFELLGRASHSESRGCSLLA